MSRTDTQELTTTRVEAATSPKGVRPVDTAAMEIDPIDTPGVQHNRGWAQIDTPGALEQGPIPPVVA